MLLPLLVKNQTCPHWVFSLIRAERDAGGRTRVRRDALHLEELLPSHPPGEPRNLTRDAPLYHCVTQSHYRDYTSEMSSVSTDNPPPQ